MSERKPLTVGGLYELLRDRRRARLVLPHTVLPMVAELHRGLVTLFDAIGAVTSDPRWREAADVIETAAEVLRKPALEKPLERARHVFEGAKAPSPLRKGMVAVRRIGAQRPR